MLGDGLTRCGTGGVMSKPLNILYIKHRTTDVRKVQYCTWEQTRSQNHRSQKPPNWSCRKNEHWPIITPLTAGTSGSGVEGPRAGNTAAALTRAANDCSRRFPNQREGLLWSFKGWKCLLALSHLRHSEDITMLKGLWLWNLREPLFESLVFTPAIVNFKL